eukprot:scaffold80190_cov57-Phaeocystis_antarctica.AAC.4
MSSGMGVSSLSRFRPVTRFERIARRSSMSAAPATPAAAMYLEPCIPVSACEPRPNLWGGTSGRVARSSAGRAVLSTVLTV